jgi:hypothetical protein
MKNLNRKVTPVESSSLEKVGDLPAQSTAIADIPRAENRMSLKKLPAIKNNLPQSMPIDNTSSLVTFSELNDKKVTEKSTALPTSFLYEGTFTIPSSPIEIHAKTQGATPEQSISIIQSTNKSSLQRIDWQVADFQKQLLPDEAERPFFSIPSSFTALAKPFVSLIQKNGELSMNLFEYESTIPKVQVSWKKNKLLVSLLCKKT